MIRLLLTAAVMGGLLQHVFGAQSARRKGGRPARRKAHRVTTRVRADAQRGKRPAA